MNTRSQVACALAGLIGFLILLPAFIIADYFVPPDADWSPEEFAAFYGENHDRLRVGLLLLIVAVTGWGTMIAVVAVQMLRFEGRRPVLTALHVVTGTMVYALLNLFTVFLIAAAFRSDRAGEDIQLLHDVGWFMAFLAAPVFCTQALAVGCAVLGDRGSATPVYPRWLGYVGIWVAILLLPGTLLLFFQTGPFAYHGVISYWIPLFTFGSWMAAQSFCALRAAQAEAKTQPAAAPESVTV